MPSRVLSADDVRKEVVAELVRVLTSANRAGNLSIDKQARDGVYSASIDIDETVRVYVGFRVSRNHVGDAWENMERR